MKIYLKNKNGEPRIRVFSIRIRETLLDALKNRAEIENRSVNNLIETILKKEIEKWDTKQHIPNWKDLASSIKSEQIDVTSKYQTKRSFWLILMR